MSQGSPFYYPGPIRTPECFHNRREEVSRALHLLSKGQCISVVGPRKIGKTSLLLHIAASQAWQEHGLPASRYLFIYMDCEGMADWPRTELYRHILDEVAQGLHAQGIEITGELDEHRVHQSFTRAIKEVRRRRQPVLMLDEFEMLGTNPHLGKDFFPSLRALAIEQEVILVTASKMPLAQILSAEPGSLLTSNFFNIFSPILLSLFSAAESRRLVEESLRRADLTLPSETLEWVLRTGGQHPFFLQVVGDHTFARLSAKSSGLDSSDYEAIERRVAQEAEGHFKYYWQDLTPEEQYVLAALPWLRGKGGYVPTLNALKQKCLLVGDMPGYTYFTPLFAQWVACQPAPGIQRFGRLCIDQKRREVFLDGVPVELTDLTYALLIYLAERKGQAVSREELDREIWRPMDTTGGEERVKTGIRSLRRALGTEGERIVSRWGQGYVFQDFP